MNNSKDRIAIVDDDKSYRKLLRLMLEQNHLPVVFEAGNGLECLFHMMSKNPAPNVVILDFNMPLMDGFETARLIKKTWKEVMIISVSAFADQESINRIKKCGADYFLIKAKTGKDLISMIRNN